MAAEAKELELLDRVLVRLVSTKTSETLTAALRQFLVPVLNKLASPGPQVRERVLAILNHVTVRVKADDDARLPVDELAELMIESASQTHAGTQLLKNLTVVFLRTGLARVADGEEKDRLALRLVHHIHMHQEPAIRNALLHLAMPLLGKLARRRLPPSRRASEQDSAAAEPLFADAADVSVIVDMAADILLSRPPDGGDCTKVAPCAAMSLNASRRVYGTYATLSTQELVALKSDVFALAEMEHFHLRDQVLLAILTSGDWNNGIAARAEDLLKRLDVREAMADQGLCLRLATFLLGTPATAQNVAADDRRRAAAPLLKQKIIAHLVRSDAAADMYPVALAVVLDAMFHAETTTKLRVAGLQFALHAIKRASDATVRKMGKLLLERGLLVLLDSLASASPAASAAPPAQGGSQADAASGDRDTIVSLTYGCIGALAMRMPDLVNGDLTLVRRLFVAVSRESQVRRLAVQSALSQVRDAFTAHVAASETLAGELLQVLEDNVDAPYHQARSCVIEWAAALFPRDNMRAVYIALLLAGDERAEVRAAAVAALGFDDDGKPAEPLPARATSRDGQEDEPSVALPAFVDALDFVLARATAREGTHAARGALAGGPPFSASVLRRILDLFERCIVENAEREGIRPAEYVLQASVVERLGAYRDFVTRCLVPHAPAELIIAATRALLLLTSRAPAHSLSSAHEAAQLTKLMGMAATSSELRENVAKLIAWIKAPYSSPWAQDRPAPSHEFWDEYLARVDGLATMTSARMDNNLGSLLVLAFTLARCVATGLAVPVHYHARAVRSLSSLLLHSSGVVAAASASMLGVIGLTRPLDAIRGLAEAGEAVAFSEDAVVERIMALLKHDDPAVVEAAATSLAFISLGNHVGGPGQVSREAVDARLRTRLERLLATADTKSEDVQFSVGEALAYMGRAPLAPVQLSYAATVFGDARAVDLFDAGGSSLAADEASGGAATDATTLVIRAVLERLAGGCSALMRTSIAVWLLTIAKLSKSRPAVRALLPDLQQAFCKLLVDNSDVTQEVASKGLSVVYELGDKRVREDLVKALMQSLAGRPDKVRTRDEEGNLATEITVPANSQDGSGASERKVSTYKELCSVAQEMGQPDLIYQFLDLVSSHSIWNSRRGAAFGFSTIAGIVGGEHLNAHVAELVPKLYRYQFDPNSKVHDAMTQVWHSVVADPKRTVDEHFDAIMDELLSSANAKEWRVRQACAGGLAELVGGREMTQIGKHLDRLWYVVLHLVDDMKETVRVVARSTCQALGTTSVRLCSTDYAGPQAASKAVAIVIPALLERGVSSRADDVRALSVKFLVQVCKHAGTRLRPHCADLVAFLLESLSSLEPAQLNYMQFHAEKMDMSQEELERARIAASNGSPLRESLDICLGMLDADAIAVLAPRLVAIIRQGIGLTTKAVTAQVVTNLCASHFQAMQPVAGKLLLTFASAFNDRSATVRGVYATAAGALARLAAPETVAKFVKSTIQLYFEPDNDAARTVAALAFREMSRGASDRLADHAAAVFPVALYGSFDTGDVTRRAWADVWRENGSGTDAAMRLYADELVALVHRAFASTVWRERAQGAATLLQLTQKSPAAVRDNWDSLVRLVLDCFGGRAWTGKDVFLEAAVGLLIARKDDLAADDPLVSDIALRLLGECTKTDMDFKTAAWTQTAVLARAFSTRLNILAPVLDMVAEARSAAADAADGGVSLSETTAMEERRNTALTGQKLATLAAVWPPPDAPRAAETYASETERFLALLADLMRGEAFNVRTAALRALETMLGQMRAWGSPNSASVLTAERLVPAVTDAVAGNMRDWKYLQVRIRAANALHALLRAVRETPAWPAVSEAARVALVLARETETDPRVLDDLDDCDAVLR